MHTGHPGWVTPAELARTRLPEALAIVGRALGTDRPDIQGQRVIELVTWALALPVAHALLDGREPPDLTHAQVWVHDDPAPGDGALVPGTGAGTPWREQLAQLVDPLVAAVSARTRRPRTALRRGVDDRVAAALIHVAQTRGDEARGCALARELYPAIDLRTLELPGFSLTVHVRAGCCLYYRIPQAKCWGCPLLSDDERRALATGG